MGPPSQPCLTPLWQSTTVDKSSYANQQPSCKFLTNAAILGCTPPFLEQRSSHRNPVDEPNRILPADTCLTQGFDRVVNTLVFASGEGCVCVCVAACRVRGCAQLGVHWFGPLCLR